MIKNRFKYIFSNIYSKTKIWIHRNNWTTI